MAVVVHTMINILYDSKMAILVHMMINTIYIYETDVQGMIFKCTDYLHASAQVFFMT